MEPDLLDLFRDLNGVIPFSYRATFSYDIGIMIDQFKNCKFTGVKKSFYLESKAYEIFVNFLEQYTDDIGTPDKRKLFRQNHLKYIKEAAEFIKENLEIKLAITDLSKKFGMSSKILQNGFRSIYGMSINEFIQNERLLEIKKLLSKSDLTITEIVYTVGLSSKSYLSKIFFDRFGITPSEYRNENRARKS